MSEEATLTPEQQEVFDKLIAQAQADFQPLGVEGATVLLAIAYVCPECSLVHHHPAQLKGLLGSMGFAGTVEFIKDIFFAANPDYQRPTEAHYEATKKAEEDARGAAMDKMLLNYKSSNPQGDA